MALAERVVGVMQMVSDDVMIIANKAEPYRFLNLPIYPDIHPGYGPLMGLYSGLKAIDTEFAFLVAVDMPFLSPDLLRFLFSLIPNYDVVVPRAYDRLHPLCAVYRRETCLPAIEQALGRKQRRLIAFHADVQVREVGEQALRKIDPDLRSLMNVNTPEELATARALAGESIL